MEEIYWLTRVGELDTALAVICGISFVSSVLLGFAYMMTSNVESERKLRTKLKRWLVGVFAFSSISFIGGLFTPSTKELLLIYGLGNTIEYVKSNDKAKHLPDKVVDALNRYVETIENENKEKSKKQ